MKIINHKYFYPIILFLLSFLTFYRLMRPGYPSMMDDMHIFRLEQFHKCIKDGQIPCRLVPDAGFGYNYPLFNFYSPLPYAIAEIFHLTGFSFINSIKIVFALIHILGVFGMYCLAKIFWKKEGAFLSSLLFLLAPYQAIDSFVRGAIAESLAINIAPWVILFIYNVIVKNKSKILLSLSIFALLLSHNLTSLSFIPVFAIFSIYLLLKNRKNIISFTVHTLLGLTLSSFFIFPAILEKKFTTVDTMTQGYFYYVAHFATLKQLFISNFWGYSASLWGPVDGMSFQIGYLLWMIPLISLIYIIVTKKIKSNLLFIILFVLSFFYIFLTHSKSTPIWIILDFMKYYQFPWRFLSVVIVLFSFISGSIVYLIKNKKISNLLLIVFSIATILINSNYFKEDIWFPNLTDKEKLSGAKYIEQSGAGLKDYWPNYGKEFPNNFAPTNPLVENDVSITNYYKNSNTVVFTANSKAQSKITLPVVFFPGWKLYINNISQNFNLTKDLGLITFDLPSGQNNIQLKFENTPIRSLSNIISLISIILTIVLFYKYKYEIKK